MGRTPGEIERLLRRPSHEARGGVSRRPLHQGQTGHGSLNARAPPHGAGRARPAPHRPGQRPRPGAEDASVCRVHPRLVVGPRGPEPRDRIGVEAEGEWLLGADDPLPHRFHDAHEPRLAIPSRHSVNLVGAQNPSFLAEAPTCRRALPQRRRDDPGALPLHTAPDAATRRGCERRPLTPAPPALHHGPAPDDRWRVTPEGTIGDG
ncbi:MAG: hypothetical protein AVDCRST_MAG49-1948 [uncultured Thermomicrobiales bacterium]|uniref:Uncharacterized protein n=1 Tax=uncultured Thermomicrobiales bacterium TaxID=1645740 RepID=A0A6J4UL13_9BACT|nr:MAG: hypothetical protein AVDCRST_MAG49-1948 [uncultured Thermomicrobiales bacterium]